MQAFTWPTSTELTYTHTKMHTQKKAVFMIIAYVRLEF